MQLAKAVGDAATGGRDEQARAHAPNNFVAPSEDEIRRVMSALGRAGGAKGGPSRAAKLSKKRRREIAQAAALARWGKK